MTTSPPIRVGVLLQSVIQFLDIAAVDILGMLTPGYLHAAGFPKDLIQKMGVNLEFVYIGERDEVAGMLTSGAKIVLTHSPEEIDRVDILVVPGPDPDYHPTPVIKALVQKCYADPATTILSICSGAMPLARSGIFTGRTVTAPSLNIPSLEAELPDVNWVVKRWVKDEKAKPAGGELWSSGAILNGIDMIVAFIRERYGEERANMVCKFADFDVRTQEFV